ncbi:hypothetical protein [Pseudarthrobacter sp. NPDC057230]|uniref:hypothetical protein n=1 Tax=Pseudarthrobacter sp. NPDC057230 TaxID=3346057 RepID=UPI003630D23A
MSLTRHLSRKESPIRQFIHESAPQLALAGTRGRRGQEVAASFNFEELLALKTQLAIPEAVKDRQAHATVAGTALDYRVRMDLPDFDFVETVAQRGLDILAADTGAVHRGKHIHKVLEQALGFAYLTWKDQASDPLSLDRASIPLAWCESIARIGPHETLSGELGRRIKRAKNAVDLMMGIDEDLLFDIALMRRSVEPLLDEWNRGIKAGADYVPNPRFLGSVAVGGADADWAVGDMLVELKTREEITSPWLRDTLFQLLGYALLDLDDSLGIRRVGILLPRQPYFAVWALDDLLQEDADKALPRLRADFALMLTGDGNSRSTIQS